MRVAGFLLLACVLTGFSKTQTSPDREFEQRIDEYMKLRKTACADVPKLKKAAEPEEIAANKSAQAEAIRRARSGAGQGDIFTPHAAAYIKKLIADYVKGPGRGTAKKAAQQGNPAAEGGAEKLTMKVNATYPDSVPLSTVPPALLLRLPKLPKEMDYRFVGRTLVLHDSDAGIIVDFLPNAMP